jgi:16S rRNA (uracil1498-N3)-methyltransferase
VVGPEGGLEPAEHLLATDLGYRPVSLGPRILRTETAGLAAIAALQATSGDMH